LRAIAKIGQITQEGTAVRLEALAAASLFAVGAPSIAHAASSCDGVRQLDLPHVTVTSAAVVAEGATLQLAAGQAPFKAPVAFCRVQGVSRPTADSEIGFEVWIPEGGRWNGKYMQAGNGGFAGGIPYTLLTVGLAHGYAVAGTDDGHRSDNPTDASFLVHHPEKLRDFGNRAIRETTVAAKGVIAAYEGRAPARSYFWGCSTGGREALMEAQRYPGDFDGVVAGAPAYAWTRLLGGGGLIQQALLQPGGFIPPAKLNLLEQSALKACDGLADGYISAPDRCRFDPTPLLCKGADGPDCLTRGELATLKVIYGGAKGPDGYAYPGYAPGAEAEPFSWNPWITGPKPGGSIGWAFVENYFARMVREAPTFDVSQLTFADIDAGRRKVEAVMNSDNPDLSAFRAHGGKLIQYHGWNDPAIAPGFSLSYYASVKRRMGDPAGFYRLYMVPGMLHCFAGRGPSNVDWLELIDGWVERGQAPGDVIARDDKGRSQTLKPRR
jgi:feruloyl esterase